MEKPKIATDIRDTRRVMSIVMRLGLSPVNVGLQATERARECAKWMDEHGTDTPGYTVDVFNYYFTLMMEVTSYCEQVKVKSKIVALLLGKEKAEAMVDRILNGTFGKPKTPSQPEPDVAEAAPARRDDDKPIPVIIPTTVKWH